MIPWPVAALALFYGAMAAFSGAALWRTICDAAEQPLL